MHCLDPDAARSATGTLALAALLAIPSFACSGGGAHAGRAARLDDLPRLVADEQIRIGDRDDPDTGFTFIGGSTSTATGPSTCWRPPSRRSANTLRTVRS